MVPRCTDPECSSGREQWLPPAGLAKQNYPPRATGAVPSLVRGPPPSKLAPPMPTDHSDRPRSSVPARSTESCSGQKLKRLVSSLVSGLRLDQDLNSQSPGWCTHVRVCAHMGRSYWSRVCTWYPGTPYLSTNLVLLVLTSLRRYQRINTMNRKE